MPALGLSLFLIAVGAILAYAVDYTTNGIDIVTIGYILMAVGFIGLLLSLLFWTSFAPLGAGRRRGYQADAGYRDTSAEVEDVEVIEERPTRTTIRRTR